ncbi:hypothetical protein LDENG_00009650 [Lucifuga dentata]|nr:hypothetical protein LDENG_00009650 [Lucifuga dentata]
MEDYEDFVQRRLSQLRKSVEDSKASTPAASLIHFYGKPILLPQLSGEQREEMQRHKNAAKKAGDQRKLQADPRMVYVQSILQSVQLRKTQTLEELFQETGIDAKLPYNHKSNLGSVSQSDIVTGRKDNLTVLPPSDVLDGKDGVGFPPLTSTTYSAFFTPHVTPQPAYTEGCLIDQHEGKESSHPDSFNCASHQSVSSGYVTFENVENVTIGHGRIETASSEENDSTSGFFLHSASNTIAKMPDIINHPPIDGEELENSVPESSFCNNITVDPIKDICWPSPQQDSVICSHFPVGISESSHLDSRKCDDNPPCTAELGKDQNQDTYEGPVSALERSDLLDNPELLTTHHNPTTDQLDFQHDPGKTEDADDQEGDLKPSEEPYRMSLQALLKKSREYRQQQRMLRNQAKNTKIQARTQDQPKARKEEQSLSDKENDEFPLFTVDRKKTRERSGTFSSETSPNKSCESEELIQREGVIKEFSNKANVKCESTHLTGDNNNKAMVGLEGEIASKNKVNCSQEFIMEPKQIEASHQQQSVILTGTSPVQEAFYLANEWSPPSAISIFNDVGKYQTIPAPHFCTSPIHSKSKSTIKDVDGAVDEAETPNRKVLVNMGLNVNSFEAEGNVGFQNSQIKAAFSTVNVVGEGELTQVLAKSSQHIDQLESNLSSLKVLISDLESTLTENSENHSQTQNSPPNDFCFKGIEYSSHFKKDQLGQSDGDDSGYRHYTEQDQRHREFKKRRSNNSKNSHEDIGPEPSISHMDSLPLTVQESSNGAVHLKAATVAKIFTSERGKEKGSVKGRQTKNSAQHVCIKQQPTAKCLLSQTQRMRIPDVFRNFPPETTVSCEVSVRSDASNQPAQRKNESAEEGKDSTRSPSLNQSYDVDTPSGLWHLEGPGGNLGSKGYCVQEKDLTPESGSEGQGGVSKVKRRLLMHLTEDAEEKNPDTRDRAGAAITPDSSTARVWWHEGGLKDKQQQMKRAHAAQVRALQDQHRRQQEELLQALAVRYLLLQNVSFPCPKSSSSFGDTLTFPSFFQPPSSLPERYCPLVLATVKGFLTRRLLRTDRVAQLRRTIKDTQQFLQAFQQQSPGRAEFCCKQDVLLQERVALQLRAARYEVYDIFFSLSAAERMQMISWDRELARERELRLQSEHTGRPRGKSSLSAATQKSLERKRGAMIQKKAAERHRGVMRRAGHTSGFSAEQPLETKER